MSPLLLLLLLGAAGCAQGLFKEQAARYTWHHQYLGKVVLAAVEHRPRARVFVATERNVLAALSSKDGSVAWRKVLGEGDTINQMLVEDGRVVLLSEGGKSLRVFDADSGAMLWANVDSRFPVADVAITAAGRGVQLLATMPSEEEVQAFNMTSGRTLWSRLIPGVAKDAKNPPVLLPGAQRKSVWAAAVQSSHLTVMLAELNASSGDPLGQAALTAPVRLDPEELLLGPKAVMAFSEGGDQICGAALEVGASDMACVELAPLFPQGVFENDAVFVRGGRCPTQAVLQFEAGAAVFGIRDGKPALVSFVAGAVASGCQALPNQPPAVAFVYPAAEGMVVETVSAEDGSTLQRAVVPELLKRRVDGGAVGALAAWLLPFKSGSKMALRTLLTLTEDTLAMLPPLGPTLDAPLAPSWQRTEALAGIQDVLIADLPAPTSENEAAWQAAQPGLGATIRAQLLALKAQLMQPSQEELAALQAYQTATNDRLRPTRDPDGFRKQIIVATEAGKVAALHNGDGRVLWALDFGPMLAPERLLLWRVPHDVQHDVEVAAIKGWGDSINVHIINAHTGELVATKNIPGEFADIIPLPSPAEVGNWDQHVYALLPADISTGAPLRPLPATVPAQQAFAAAAANFSFWWIADEEGTVRGFGLDSQGRAEERWAVVAAAPDSGQAILEVAAHDAREAVQSHAKVLGDDSLKFKYLNPNTLLVAVGRPLPGARQGAGGVESLTLLEKGEQGEEEAGAETGAEAGAGAGAKGEPEDEEVEEEPPVLTVMLLDAITGRVLDSQKHEGGIGPVRAILCEHWAVYQFWDLKESRWQVSVIELYDAAPHDLRVMDLAFEEASATQSSWDVPSLEVLSQSFFSRLPVMQLGVTRTARGITARQLLMATPAGAVYMLDKRIVDPRRPRVAPGSKPTPEQAAEGLMPYAEELPFSPLMFASQDKLVRGLRSVVTAPAALESTSLMFAHGLDLFYTRLAPSRTFDELPEDFPFALLILIVLGMAGASAALSVLNRRAALKKKWE